VALEREMKSLVKNVWVDEIVKKYNIEYGLKGVGRLGGW
jgi:hypothetical protein